MANFNCTQPRPSFPGYARTMCESLIDGIWLSDNVMTMSNHDHDNDDEKMTNYPCHLHIRDTPKVRRVYCVISGQMIKTQDCPFYF